MDVVKGPFTSLFDGSLHNQRPQLNLDRNMKKIFGNKVTKRRQAKNRGMENTPWIKS